MRQYNTVNTFFIKCSFSSIGQDRSKPHKKISKLLSLNEMAALHKLLVNLTVTYISVTCWSAYTNR